MWSALIILLFACVLMVANYTEGFENPPGMCGVDLAPCPHGSRCMNGYCKSDIPSKLPYLSDLPMTPPTKYPYA